MTDPADAGGAMRPDPSEGYVRFHTLWIPGCAPRHPALAELDTLRTELWDRGWVGATSEGIGFGNLSVRDPAGAATFVITGTATGARRVLGADGYVRVAHVDAPGNTVECAGPIRASAETMSHAALYEADPRIVCVVHIHAPDFWARALALGWPATPAGAEYGTPDLAAAVGELARRLGAGAGLMTLAGHQDGMLAYGPGVAEAGAVLLDAYQQIGFGRVLAMHPRARREHGSGRRTEGACSQNGFGEPWRVEV